MKTQVHLTDHQTFYLLQKHFVPSFNYKFPTCLLSNIPRYFHYSWLKSNPGLVYSESETGGYCKYCVQFGRCEPRIKELSVFVNKPFTNFKKASELLGSHFHDLGNSKGNRTDQNAVHDGSMFVKMMKDSSVRIDHQLIISTLHSKKIAENHLKL